MKTLSVGIVGCGNISPIYLTNLSKFSATTVAALADLDLDRAAERAKEYNVPKVCTVDEMLADPGIDLVLDITVPGAHFDVNRRALEAGKHTYTEKPLSVTREEGKALVDLAKSKGVRLGCAPDTVLGGGIQSCRKLLDEGVIGDVVGVQAFMLCGGHEGWHPSPEFYYKVGGGPMFDMGPYYLTALVTLLGSVKRVAGATRISFPTRTITSQPKAGQVIEVETPTHLTSVLEFESGAIGQLTTSFDVQASSLPNIEIYGSKGSMQVPDPNTFGGPIRIKLKGEEEWKEVPLTHSFAENSRGVGILDIAYSIAKNRPHRASGALAYHVLDVMHAVHESSDQGKFIQLTSQVERPAAFAAGQPEGEIAD